VSALRELRFLLPRLRPYRWRYAVGGACVVGAVALKVFIPRYLGEAFDRLLELEREGSMSALAEDALKQVGALALAIVGLAAGVALVRTASRILVLGTCRRIVHDLRRLLFGHLLTLAPSFYARHPTGQLMSRCVNDMQNVQGLTGPVFLYIVETATLYAVCITFMWGVSPQLTLVAMLPFPLFLLLARRLAARVQQGSREAQQKLGEVSAKVDESLSGHLVIRSLALEGFDRDRFARHCDDFRSLNLRVTRARALLVPMMNGLASLGTLLVLLVGGPWLVRGEVSLGSFVAMVLYLEMMTVPTLILGFVISSLQRGTAALGRIREVFEFQPALRDPDDPLEEGVVEGEIRVRDLSVRFPALAEQELLSGTLSGQEPAAGGGASDERVVLEGISLDVPAGTTLGVVGRTGAGKTTLVRVLARQLEVERGHVFIDGRDVMDMRLADVRRRIGLVPQETFLFSESLADNIALGLPDAERAAVEEAAEVSRISTDLAQLPDGLDTQLGERGVNLSGGQRQRTALARVVLLEPRILILDDTLSAVDTHTADEIMARLRPMMAGRTTVIVAHRVSTVRHADQIAVLDEGRLAELGSHSELVAAGGLYAQLWERQRAREALEADLDLEGGEVDW